MNKSATPLERAWMGEFKRLPCVICTRITPGGGITEVHHIAEGTAPQNNWLIAPLCEEHHRGGAGLHGMGTKAFLRLYRPPHESEYGLMAWALEDYARFTQKAKG